jgi:sugar phosphate isomerase/epimerase
VKKMRAILDAHGLEASMLGLWGWNHLSADASERQTCHGHLARAIEFAKILGAEVFTTGGGTIPDASREQNVEEFAKVFPPFVKQATDAQLKFAIYPVHGASFFDSLKAYELAWEKVPEIGIKFDPANIHNHGDDEIEWVRTHGNRIYHVHIKEHLYHGGKLASQPAAGMGDVPCGKIMAFLYEHKYDGYLSMEPHGPIWGRPPLLHKMVLLSKRYIEQFLV